MNDETLDLIIIGAGPTGYTAAIYAARYMLKCIVIADIPGGLMLYADIVDNFPGFPGIFGADLMDKLKEHVLSLNATIVQERATSIEKQDDSFYVSTKSKIYPARSIIMATGSERRKLGIKGEDEFLGSGVSYCATCDVPFFRNKITCVIGGSDSAAKEALVLSRVAKKVYVIYRKEKLRAEPSIAEQVYSCHNVEVIHEANVIEIVGCEGMVSKVVLDNGNEIPMDGVFIDVGYEPCSEIVKNVGVEMDLENQIIVDKEMKTNIEGIFAAGDVTNSLLKQAITAAADGAKACWSAFRYIQDKFKETACNPDAENDASDLDIVGNGNISAHEKQSMLNLDEHASIANSPGEDGAITSVEEFTELVSSHEIVVCDFFTTWCGPCKLLAPKFVEITNEMKSRPDIDITFCRVDCDKLKEIANELEIKSVPTVVFYINGNPSMDKMVGNQAKENYMERINKILNERLLNDLPS